MKNLPVYLFFFILFWTLFTLIKKFSLLQSLNILSISSPLLFVKSNINIKKSYESIADTEAVAINTNNHNKQGLRSQNSETHLNQAFISGEAKFLSQQIDHKLDLYHDHSITSNQKHKIESDQILYQEQNQQYIQPSSLVSPTHHKIEYGGMMANGKRPPLVMIRSNLSTSVHQLLLNQDLFKSNEEDLPTLHKLYKAVDYVRAKDTHFYYEGYFHSLLTSDPILSRNPRSGQEFQKPAAPLVIRAFFESLRRLNKDTFSTLQQRLYQSALSRVPHNYSTDACGMLSDWIAEGRLFSDISIQLHYGSHIHGDQLFWHSDAENSLLHFGLTISGYRILHSKRAKTESSTVITEVLEDQPPGTVYLSSSTLMNHAPEYPANTWNDRIIAMQARIMYTNAQLKQFRAVRTEKSWAELTHILSHTLSQATLHLPTISNIQAVIDEMSNSGNT